MRQPFAIIGEADKPQRAAEVPAAAPDGTVPYRIDVRAGRVAGGVLLDVNMGAPLADEAELM